VLGAAGEVVPGSAADGAVDGGSDDGGVDDGGSEDGGVDDGGADDGGVDDGGAEDGGAEDGGVDDGGAEDGGVDDGGVDDGGAEDGGADECDGLADGDPEPPGCPGKRLTGTGGIDVLDPDRAGVKNAFGETRADAGGAGEEPVRELGAGLDDTEAGDVATAPAPACGCRWLAAGVWWLAPIRAKAATAEPTTSPPVRHAEASGREIRCRPGPPVARRGC
jgi:hypothetical protein